MYQHRSRSVEIKGFDHEHRQLVVYRQPGPRAGQPRVFESDVYRKDAFQQSTIELQLLKILHGQGSTGGACRRSPTAARSSESMTAQKLT